MRCMQLAHSAHGLTHTMSVAAAAAAAAAAAVAGPTTIRVCHTVSTVCFFLHNVAATTAAAAAAAGEPTAADNSPEG
jgi:hypothetical protein